MDVKRSFWGLAEFSAPTLSHGYKGERWYPAVRGLLEVPRIMGRREVNPELLFGHSRQLVHSVCFLNPWLNVVHDVFVWKRLKIDCVENWHPLFVILIKLRHLVLKGWFRNTHAHTKWQYKQNVTSIIYQTLLNPIDEMIKFKGELRLNRPKYCRERWSIKQLVSTPARAPVNTLRTIEPWVTDCSPPLSPIITEFSWGEGTLLKKDGGWSGGERALGKRKSVCCFRWPNLQASSWSQEVTLEGGIGSSLAKIKALHFLLGKLAPLSTLHLDPLALIWLICGQ